MEIYKGKSIYRGTVIGKVFFYGKNSDAIIRKTITDVNTEIARFETARTSVKKQLLQLAMSASGEVGADNARIFEVHAMLLDEDDFVNSVVNIVSRENANAEYAVSVTGDALAYKFSRIKDEYFRERSADIRDICERVIDALQDNDNSKLELSEPVIVVAEDLSPGETVRLNRKNLLSLVTRLGSSNSHTAILAGTMGLPSLIGVEVCEKWNGRYAIVDGNEGKFIIDPDEATLMKYTQLIELEDERKKLLESLKGQPNITKDGKNINLYANIDNADEIEEVIANGARGIGLFRSEFLYMEKKDYPTEEEQFEVYKNVALKMGDNKVIIRTLDIGADKQADYLKLNREANPAMGFRAIRICLEKPEIFITQLRAIYRASAFGNISILIPMIISLEEVMEVKKICNRVKEELTAEGKSFKDVALGVMIETPAAVMISDLLAKEVDFFSIGTNDLTQYTLAVDRQNPMLEKQYNPYHEGILRMIRMVIENGHDNNCPVGLCGELAADTAFTETLIKMGIDGLSVSPSFILPVRKAIRDASSV